MTVNNLGCVIISTMKMEAVYFLNCVKLFPRIQCLMSHKITLLSLGGTLCCGFLEIATL